MQLSKPKIPKHNNIQQSRLWEWSEWSNEHLYIPTASEWVCRLAESKTSHKDYVPPKPVESEVIKDCLNYMATERIVKLAKPKNKHLESEDYDPHTWEVSHSALMAQASQRINELATPLPRKVRTKK